MQKLKSIVVEDDSASRLLMCDLLMQSGKIEVVDNFENPLDALQFLSSNTVDVVFLDVEMPEMSGVDLAKNIPSTTKIIITTSKEKYAVDAFDIDAFSFILKPIDLPKLLNVIRKIEASATKSVDTEKPIFIKTKSGFNRIEVDKIQFVQAYGDYINYVGENQKYMARQSMKEVLEQVEHLNFVQVHRSYIVNLDFVNSFTHDAIEIGEDKIPLSRGYKDNFLARINKIV